MVCKKDSDPGPRCARNYLWDLGWGVQPVRGSCPSKHNANPGRFLSSVGYLPIELYSRCFEGFGEAGVYLFGRMFLSLCICLDSLYNVKDHGVFEFKQYYSFLETQTCCVLNLSLSHYARDLGG